LIFRNFLYIVIKKEHFFKIKKYGEFSCEICNLIKSNPKVFNILKELFDLIFKNKGYYKEFLNIYDTSIIKEYYSLLLKKK